MISTDTVLGLYGCQKYIYQPKNRHSRCPGMVLQPIVRFFENSENFEFWEKSYLKVSFFQFWGLKKKTFLENRDSHFKQLYTLRILVFFCILLRNLYF